MIKYPLIKPDMPKISKLTPYFKRVWENNWYSNNGPLCQEFEKLIADYYGLNTKKVVLCNNATIGLIASLKSFDHGGNWDTPSYTFPATVQALQWNNLKYKYLDINPCTHHADLNITNRSNNLMYVLPYGCPPLDYSYFKEYERVVIDAASSFGFNSEHMKNLLRYADTVVFSLHATKSLGVGEGAICVFKSVKVADKFRRIINFGFDDNKNVIEGGLNGKLCEVLACIGIEKFKGLSNFLKKKNKLIFYYRKELEGFDTNINLYDDLPWQFVPLTINDNRDKVMEIMRKKYSIITGKYYQPFDKHEKKRITRRNNLKITEDISKRTLSLPIYNTMSKKDVKYICESLLNTLSY